MSTPPPPPRGRAQFHNLLLFPTKLMALSKVTGEIAYEQGFGDRLGEMRGMALALGAPDDVHPLIWVYSARYGLYASTQAIRVCAFALVWVFGSFCRFVLTTVVCCRRACCWRRSLYRLEVREERRDVWQQYLSLGRTVSPKFFSAALKYASVRCTEGPPLLNRVVGVVIVVVHLVF